MHSIVKLLEFTEGTSTVKVNKAAVIEKELVLAMIVPEKKKDEDEEDEKAKKLRVKYIKHEKFLEVMSKKKGLEKSELDMLSENFFDFS